MSDWQSLIKNYDFPYVVGISRALQFCCCLIQILMIYSESGSIKMFSFVWYNILLVMYTTHIFRRWYCNIDGRFDLHQLIREPENTVKIQYSIALFTPTVLSILLLACVHHHYDIIRFFWRITCSIQILLATGLLFLETFEVFVKEN
ncbi:hypothetical protein V3C99_005857 [Haemonchus contortus]